PDPTPPLVSSAYSLALPAWQGFFVYTSPERRSRTVLARGSKVRLPGVQRWFELIQVPPAPAGRLFHCPVCRGGYTRSRLHLHIQEVNEEDAHSDRRGARVVDRGGHVPRRGRRHRQTRRRQERIEEVRGELGDGRGGAERRRGPQRSN